MGSLGVYKGLRKHDGEEIEITLKVERSKEGFCPREAQQ